MGFQQAGTVWKKEVFFT